LFICSVFECYKAAALLLTLHSVDATPSKVSLLTNYVAKGMEKTIDIHNDIEYFFLLFYMFFNIAKKISQSFACYKNNSTFAPEFLKQTDSK
jgi:hypothetical protein